MKKHWLRQNKLNLLAILTIAILAVALFYWYEYSNTSLGQRLIKINNKLMKIREKSRCYSVLDCKMELLLSNDCAILDYIYPYSKRSDSKKEIHELIAEYNKLLIRLNLDSNNKLNCNKPMGNLKCIKGQCSYIIQTRN